MNGEQNKSNKTYLQDADGPRESYVRNCLIKISDNQDGAIFCEYPDGSVSVHLDGYAIIPKNEYLKLTASWWRRLFN